MKRIKLVEVATVSGEALPADTSGAIGSKAGLGSLLKLIVWRIPPEITPIRKCTMKDGHYAIRFFEQLAKVKDDVLELEDEDYAWLEGIIEYVGPLALSINAIKVKMALRDNIIEEK